MITELKEINLREIVKDFSVSYWRGKEMLDGITVATMAMNVIGSYIIYKAMGLFFSERQTSRVVEVGSYVLQYVIYHLLICRVGILGLMIIAHLVSFFLITLNYESSMRKRCIASVSIFVMLMITELLSATVFDQWYSRVVRRHEDSLLLSVVIMHLLSYVIVMSLS